MSENAALEVSPHFLRYVPWQLAVCCLQLCQKRLQVARHRPIQGLGFRLATTRRDSGHAVGVISATHTPYQNSQDS